VVIRNLDQLPIQYGIVGASKFAEFCLAEYRRMESLKPAAVWSRTAARATAFAERHGLRHCDTLDELVQDPSIEMVHVATIPALHAEHVRAALEHGKHVLCEKPLAITPSDAARMIEVAHRNGLRLGTNFVMRYGPLWEPMRTLIEEKVMGKLLRGELFNCAGDAGLPPGHWFWDKQLSGGIFIEHGVHFFDLVRSWLGEGIVDSALQMNRPDTGEVDQVHCDVRFGDDTCVGFYHGFHQTSYLDRQELKLIFERGDIMLRGWVAGEAEVHAAIDTGQIARLEELFPGGEMTVVKRFDGDERTVLRRGREERVDAVVRLRWSAGSDKGRLYGRAVRELMEDQLRAIRDDGYRPRVTAEDGLAALMMAVDAERLACEGTT